MANLASYILGLPPWVALLVVFAFPALESSAFIGFIFPGEIALVLGGVIAAQGRVPLAAVLAAAIAGAVAGDSVGYVVGKRYGRRLLDGTVGRFVKSSHLDRAETYLAARGGRAVFFGRFTATLRVLVPGLAGMSGLRSRTFLTYNVASAVGWGTLSVMLGYLGGSNWRHVADTASRLGLAVLVLAVVTIVGGFLHRHLKARGPGPDVLSEDAADDRAGRWDVPRGRRTIVVIPTYNESGNIDSAIERVRTAAPGVDVLVVDDSSPDRTADLVTGHAAYSAHPRPGCRLGSGMVFLLSRTAKDGLGAAYRAGFGWALDRGYDDIVQMDADLSHPAERIPALCQALATADVVIGSRYVPGGAVRNWSPTRRLISWVGNVYVRLVLGLPVHDTTAGFKAFRREALEHIGALDSVSNGYCLQIENTWRAVRLGLVVAEVPITFTDRTVGISKMSVSIVGEAVARVLVWRWREITGQLSRLLTREVLTFLGVGGAGYVVDVAAFNGLRSLSPFSALDPSVARTLAVVVAMCVTYAGNRSLTWRGRSTAKRRREVSLFVLFNVIGFGFSGVTLAISHDLLGLTSRLADNVSANVIGLALGTVFRFLTYKRFVFAPQPAVDRLTEDQTTGDLAAPVPPALRRAPRGGEVPVG
jgi:membrane protein DedA with SNARE-associated domain/putative flippase GtrA